MDQVVGHEAGEVNGERVLPRERCRQKGNENVVEAAVIVHWIKRLVDEWSRRMYIVRAFKPRISLEESCFCAMTYGACAYRERVQLEGFSGQCCADISSLLKGRYVLLHFPDCTAVSNSEYIFVTILRARRKTT